jgi:hypothetical protein
LVAAAFLVLAFLGAGLFPQSAFGESSPAGGTNEGMIAETLREADLFSEPDEASVTQGRLPEGTLLRLLGKRKGVFENVEVELVDGIAEGWVQRKALNLKDQELQMENWDTRVKYRRSRKEPQKEATDDRRGPIVVPKDEVLLIRRQPSFFYGLVAELPLTYITDTRDNLFSGINYRLGVHGGFFLGRNTPLRFELAYTRVGGTADGASAQAGPGSLIELGFADFRTQLELGIGNFAILGFAQYSFGTGVEAAPPSVNFGSAGSLSSFWVGVGGGYRVAFTQTSAILLQLTYSLSLLREPLGFQAFGFRLVWEIRG